MITTKAVMDSLLGHAADVESLAVLSRFRVEFHACLTARGDELFELADAVLCADGPVKTLAGLLLAGLSLARSTAAATALYDAVNHGQLAIGRLRWSLAALGLPLQTGPALLVSAEPHPLRLLHRPPPATPTSGRAAW
jgi:hypothetical protein